MQEDEVTGEDNKEDNDQEEKEHNLGESALTKNMNATMEKTCLCSMESRNRM
jgi:hypothetical protein